MWSKEAKERASNAHTGKPHPHKGKPLSEEAKRKISKARKGKKLSEEHKRKMSIAHKGQIPWNTGKKGVYSLKRLKAIADRHRGSNSHFWQGGISPNPYATDWTKTLKRAIRERDNYICQLCSQYGIIVHHIDYDKNNCSPYNLITLCRPCHSKTNFNREYWKAYWKQ